jgi:hypothetical protein
MPTYEQQWADSFDQRQVGRLHPNSLLVVKEKHGDRYFAVPTLEALYRVALSLIQERFESDYFYEPEEFEPSEDFPKEELTKIKKSPYGEEFLKNYQTNAQRKEDHDAEAKDYVQIETAIKDKDGRLAWYIVINRKFCEYEGYELICTEDANGTHQTC